MHEEYVGHYSRDQQPQKRQPIGEVASPKPRFLLDSPEPFQAGALNPSGCTPRRPGDEVHHGAKVADHRRRNARTIVFDPSLTLPGAKRYHQKIRAARIDPRDGFVIAHFSNGAESGAHETGAHQPGRTRIQPPASSLGNAFLAAIKIHLQSDGCVLPEALEQVRTRNARPNRDAEQACYRYHRHTVRDAEIAMHH